MSPGPPPTISSEPTPTEIATAPSPSVSTTQQTEIPASTVIAIGLGFVALTVCGLLGLIGLRVLKVYRTVRRRRRNGEQDVHFRREWRRAGGMFGFMSGFNNGAGDSALIVGAGGVEMRRRIELLMLREGLKEDKMEMVEPVLWDARIGSDRSELGREEMEQWDTLSLAQTSPPFLDPQIQGRDPPSFPSLIVSVLVAMPAATAEPPHRPDGNDTWELPEVMIGLTDVSPTIAIKDAQKRESTGRVAAHPEQEADRKQKVDVEHVEHVPAESLGGPGTVRRRAAWKKDKQGRWYVEGLRDL